LIIYLVINRFTFDIELIVALQEKGYRIVDAPVKIEKRTKSTAANISTIVNMLCDTLKVWYRKKKGLYAGN
jgi:hypothetical protein